MARLKRWLTTSALLLLYVLSTPVGGSHLIALLETAPPLSLHHLPPADAIVILGGGVYRNAPEYAGGDTVNRMTLERLRYGARLYRASGLPVAVSGGNPGGGLAEAQTMRAVLQQDFGVPVRWLEARSRNTWENARDCRALLPPQVHTILLVSQAWHLLRAQAAFERAGFMVIPAGTSYSLTRPLRLSDFMPQPDGWTDTYLAMHELLGRVWYQIKYLDY